MPPLYHPRPLPTSSPSCACACNQGRGIGINDNGIPTFRNSHNHCQKYFFFPSGIGIGNSNDDHRHWHSGPPSLPSNKNRCTRYTSNTSNMTVELSEDRKRFFQLSGYRTCYVCSPGFHRCRDNAVAIILCFGRGGTPEYSRTPAEPPSKCK